MTAQPHSTSGVHLRAIEPEDLDLLYSIENDTTLWNVGTTNVPYSRYTLHDYIATSSDDIYADRQLRLIVENAQGESVGVADLMHFDPQHLRAETGIVIMQPWRRRGYAAAAIAALCDYALRVVHLHQLYAVIAADNKAARSLFTKVGFQGGVVLSDWLYDGRQYADACLMQKKL
ncbi:MAG: GNAT family N-acetyltransferase [Prevotella sp.]|nr:GNAT family N-acetyltransferase [Prevotella sp.]MBQ9203510.1 GNAT family N-acetyltransferase [Prevotella sp.]